MPIRNKDTLAPLLNGWLGGASRQNNESPKSILMIMSTKMLNGSPPQAAEELIKRSAEMPANLLAKHNISLAKSTLVEESPQQVQPQNLKVKPSGRYYESNITKNIRNGELVVNYLISYGDKYNPSREAIFITALQALNLQAHTYIGTVRDNKQTNSNEKIQRRDVYGNLKPLATRILNELIASGAPKSVVKTAKHFVKNIQGARIIKITPETADDKHSSASHTSFAEQIQNLSGLVGVLNSAPEYKPNIPELTTAALTAKINAMIASNGNEGTSKAEWSTSIVERNKFFNQEYTGYIDIYASVKRAVKAIFGATSPEYKQISALTFVRIYD